MSLFINTNRDFDDSKPVSMSLYDYTTRSTKPEVIEVCRQWDLFFNEYPAEHRAQLQGLLKSKDNRQHISAVFELFLFVMFKRLGFDVEIHLTTNSNKSGRPDFKLSKYGKDVCYVEAKCNFDVNDKEERIEKRRSLLFEAINKIPSNDYVFKIKYEGKIESNPKIKEIIRFITEWMNSLDKRDVEQRYIERKFDYLQTLNINVNGLKLWVSAVSMNSLNMKKAKNRILLNGPRLAELDRTSEKISIASRKKLKHYGNLDLPMILAFNVCGFGFDKEDILDAQWYDNQKQKNTGACARLYFKNLDMYSYKYQEPIIVFNPNIDMVYPLSEISNFHRHLPDKISNKFVEIKGEGISKLFDD